MEQREWSKGYFAKKLKQWGWSDGIIVRRWNDWMEQGDVIMGWSKEMEKGNGARRWSKEIEQGDGARK